jgi:methylase of polypeptide subunit release factors
VGFGQADAVAALVREAGFPTVSVHADLGGVQRVVIGQR